MLSEYITSLADVSFHIVAYRYARFRYSGKNPMRFAVFWRIFLCGFAVFGPPLRPPPNFLSLQKSYGVTIQMKPHCLFCCINQEAPPS